MIKIPGQLGWKKTLGDALGSLWSTFGLDFQSNQGKVRAHPRTLITTDDITDLDVAVAFQTFTDVNAGIQYAWAVAGTYVFRMNLSSGYQTAFAKDAATGTPNGSGAANSCSSDASDLISYSKTYMFLSTRADIFAYTASSGQWTSSSSSLTDGFTHMLCKYGSRVYVTDNNVQVRSFAPTDINTISSSGTYYLDLSSGGYPVTTITTIREASDGIWVFTINQSEDGCFAFKWDGVKATDPNSAYVISDASGVLAAIIKNDVPWVIDNNGDLRVFNGGTFIKTKDAGLAEGRLPIKSAKFLKNPLSAANDRWIHPNGIDIVDGRIRILVNNEYEDNGATIEENFASGVWEYDPKIGWTHLMPLSLYVNSVTDYGQNRVSRVGALYAAKTETTNSSANGTMLLGAQLYSDASSTKEVILIDDTNDTVQKFAYLVTTKIYSDQVRDTWKKLFARLKKLLNSTDRVWVRYRTSEIAPVEATITWTSATTATSTSTDDLSAYEDFEIEVLQGKGAGKCSRISDVSGSSGNWTLTFAETFTGATSGTAKARFQKWIEAGVVFSSQTDDVAEFPLEASSPWIQFKLCMQFTGKNEVDDLLLANTTHQKIEV